MSFEYNMDKDTKKRMERVWRMVTRVNSLYTHCNYIIYTVYIHYDKYRVEVGYHQVLQAFLDFDTIDILDIFFMEDIK